MKNLHIIFYCLASLCLSNLSGQHTFSIVAVDSITGEIGSAGATCLDLVQEGASALIISDIVPGIGAIHTQAAYLPANQSAAKGRMELGFSPQQIIDHLVSNDAGGNASVRQYGIVDLDANNHPRAAAHTGVNCFDHKDHRLGVNYSIQGNILIGPEVLDSMEAKFLNTAGSLAEKLMAAMQGANIPGADERCLDEGVSSRSSFLRVWHPDAGTSSDLYLDLHVGATPFAVEPIDSLQALFSEWLLTDVEITEDAPSLYKIAKNPTNDSWSMLGISFEEDVTAALVNLAGQTIATYTISKDQRSFEIPGPTTSGVYLLYIRSETGQLLTTDKLIKK